MKTSKSWLLKHKLYKCIYFKKGLGTNEYLTAVYEVSIGTLYYEDVLNLNSMIYHCIQYIIMGEDDMSAYITNYIL